MSSMRKSFFKGKISPTLVRLWDINNYEDGTIYYWNKLRRKIWAQLIVLAVISLSLGLSINKNGIVSILSILMFTILFFMWLNLCDILSYKLRHMQRKPQYLSVLPDKRFMRDSCELLRELTQDAGFLNEMELRELADTRLTELAYEVVKDEILKGKMSPSQDCKREKFKKNHTLFKKFGLVNNEYTKYFKTAEQRAQGGTAIKHPQMT